MSDSTCGCGSHRSGFMLDDDPMSDYFEMWVHVDCGKPTSPYLEAHLRELGFYNVP